MDDDDDDSVCPSVHQYVCYSRDPCQTAKHVNEYF